jgi:hypothetical protein
MFARIGRVCRDTAILRMHYKSAEAVLAALKPGSKSSCTICTFRFFACFCLAIIGLIEFLEASLWMPSA